MKLVIKGLFTSSCHLLRMLLLGRLDLPSVDLDLATFFQSLKLTLSCIPSSTVTDLTPIKTCSDPWTIFGRHLSKTRAQFSVLTLMRSWMTCSKVSWGESGACEKQAVLLSRSSSRANHSTSMRSDIAIFGHQH